MEPTLIRIEKKHGSDHPDGPVDDVLVLPFHLRDKTRLRVRLESGREAGLFLERGALIRDGEILESENGLLIRVEAARETLSRVASTDPRLMVRMAYHLGNRHTPVEIGDGVITYPHDHVLDAMIDHLGAQVTVIEGPFVPEDGAYHGGGHGH